MMSFEESVFSLASRQLAGQKEDLRNFRNQASLSAAITGLIATAFSSMLASDSLRERIFDGSTLGVSIEFIFVVVSLSASLAFSIHVVSGWKQVIFEQSPGWIFKQLESGKTQNEIYQKLALEADQFFDENEKVISTARANLQLSLIFGWLQIPAWLFFIF